MRFASLQKLFNPLAKAALLVQIIGLFFCGEADCLQGGSCYPNIRRRSRPPMMKTATPANAFAIS